MTIFDRLFGKGRLAKLARRAELVGDLGRAVLLYSEAGRLDEAARVMMVRGDGESDPRTRLVHYTQGLAAAPEGTEIRRVARKKRAELVLAMCQDTALSAVARKDLAAAALELEALGESLSAAEAYALAGDDEGHARALAASGDVEKLEQLLLTQQTKERGERVRTKAHADIEMLVASGRRREALTAATELARERPDDLAATERLTELRARRALGPTLEVAIEGKRMTLVLGDEIVVGRTEGTLTVASHAISRRHVRIARRGTEGEPFVEDLGSRNGTHLAGMRIAGAIAVGAPVDFRLGGEVPMRLHPSEELPGGVVIELAGARYVAPLGPARLRIGAWMLAEGADHWVELIATDPPAFRGEVALEQRITLFTGDAIARVRGGPPVLEVFSPSL